MITQPGSSCTASRMETTKVPQLLVGPTRSRARLSEAKGCMIRENVLKCSRFSSNGPRCEGGAVPTLGCCWPNRSAVGVSRVGNREFRSNLRHLAPSKPSPSWGTRTAPQLSRSSPQGVGSAESSGSRSGEARVTHSHRLRRVGVGRTRFLSELLSWREAAGRTDDYPKAARFGEVATVPIQLAY